MLFQIPIVNQSAFQPGTPPMDLRGVHARSYGFDFLAARMKDRPNSRERLREPSLLQRHGRGWRFNLVAQAMSATEQSGHWLAKTVITISLSAASSLCSGFPKRDSKQRFLGAAICRRACRSRTLSARMWFPFTKTAERLRTRPRRRDAAMKVVDPSLHRFYSYVSPFADVKQGQVATRCAQSYRAIRRERGWRLRA